MTEIITDFSGFGLPAPLNKSLERMNYDKATPIQAQAIPLAMAGRDIIGSARTGTGKTAAFGIPIVAKLLESPGLTALILTPTRELATQVLDVIRNLIGGQQNIKSALLIGGEPLPKQFAQLRSMPRVVVGTPGRVNDHLKRGSLKLNNTRLLVLDETDRMLDMGFGIQLDAIVKYLPQDRQTMMFSATIPKDIERLASKYLRNPERIAVGSTVALADNLKQRLVHTSEANKYEELLKEIVANDGPKIVFVKTKRGAKLLAEKLYRQHHEADAIHGDLQQRKRDRVIKDFRDGKFDILVATDVAARGLDIPDVKLVVVYDVPHSPEDYIHRIGRTARAGAEGSAVCFLSPEDGRKWKAITRMLNPGAHDNDRHPLGRHDRPAFSKDGKHRRPFNNRFKRFGDRKAA